MFFIQGDITIQATTGLAETAALVTRALSITPLTLDDTGRFEEVPAFVSACFGLEFILGRTEEDPPGTFQLAIISDVDAFDFDGTERDVDATDYTLILLRRAGIRADHRDPKLLY